MPPWQGGILTPFPPERWGFEDGYEEEDGGSRSGVGNARRTDSLRSCGSTTGGAAGPRRGVQADPDLRGDRPRLLVVSNLYQGSDHRLLGIRRNRGGHAGLLLL